ncbi:MAG: hypothetical protein E7Z92_07060 [Cyanobacteria bacterium SIG31]|nr:hypothetical protein [Cyanobacteria bacterium SIG31]
MKISLGITDYGYYTNKKKKINSAQKTGLFSMPSFKSITAGGNVLKAEVYEAFEKFKTRNAQPFKNLPTEEIDKIFKIFSVFEENFICSKDAIEEVLQEKKPAIDNLYNLVSRFKSDKISLGYLLPLLNLGRNNEQKKIDFKVIEEILDFRNKAVENKHLLDTYKKKTLIREVDELLLRSPIPTYKTLKVLGEQAFIYSFKEKRDNVVNYISELGLKEIRFNTLRNLKAITNPKHLHEFKELEHYIKNLKQSLKKADSTESDKIKQEINKASSIRNSILKRALKDPKDILESALIVSALDNNGLHDEALNIIPLLTQKSKDGIEKLNRYLNKTLYEFYKLDPASEELLQTLDFTHSKYLMKLFYARRDFKENFSKLLKLINIETKKGKTIPEVLDDLNHNKITREEFGALGLNYDAWSKANPNLKFETKTQDGNVLKVQKVDMDNITHSIFLGEDACCCTKTNGSYARSAVSYITSKMIQALEFYHNDIPIGNTMCYLAKVGGEVSLILDNIEIKPQYQSNLDTLIKKLIKQYTKKLAQDIGKPDMPVYLSARRNDISTHSYKTGIQDISIIGNSGSDLIYFDFKDSDISINDSSRNFENVRLHQISEKGPEFKKICTNDYIIGSSELYINFPIDLQFD